MNNLEKNGTYYIEDDEFGSVKVEEGKLTRALRARDEKKALQKAKLAEMTDDERKAYKRNRIIGGVIAAVSVLGAAIGIVAGISSHSDEEADETDTETEDNITPIDAEWTEVEDVSEAVSE